MALVRPPEFRVWAAGSYYNRQALERARELTPGVYDGLNFLRVIYGVKTPEDVTRFTRTPPVRGRSFLISEDRQSAAVRHSNAIAYVAARVRAEPVTPSTLGLHSPHTLVPVPSTEVVAGHALPAVWAARDLIMGIAGTARLCPIVRFTDPPPEKASQGGPRHWRDLKPRMCLTGQVPLGVSSAVIVDDVATSGGHLQAVAMMLIEAGIEEVAAMCVGATVDHPVDDPWQSVFYVLRRDGSRDPV